MRNLLFMAMTGPETLYEETISPKSIEWYKNLDLFQRISLKEMSQIICGIKFEFLTNLFGFKGAINLLYEKLILEKIIQP